MPLIVATLSARHTANEDTQTEFKRTVQSSKTLSSTPHHINDTQTHSNTHSTHSGIKFRSIIVSSNSSTYFVVHASSCAQNVIQITCKHTNQQQQQQQYAILCGFRRHCRHCFFYVHINMYTCAFVIVCAFAHLITMISVIAERVYVYIYIYILSS